jgi:hypothetical protein
MSDQATPEEQAKARALLKSPEAAALSPAEYHRALMHAAGYLTTEEARTRRREQRRQWGRIGGRVSAAKRAKADPPPLGNYLCSHDVSAYECLP